MQLFNCGSIFRRNCLNASLELFKLDAPYSNEEINAVRDEFAEFVKPLIID
ncbi:hypothetical protein CsatB_007213 [Cannabis sativa]